MDALVKEANVYSKNFSASGQGTFVFLLGRGCKQALEAMKIAS